MNITTKRKALLGTGLLSLGIAGWWAVAGGNVSSLNVCGIGCGGNCGADVTSSTLPAGTLTTAGASSENSSTAAPDWEFKDLDGKTIRSSDYKGKVVILDFWATWCGSCRQEIPGFIALQKQYGKQGLAVIGASVDETGADQVKAFAQKLGINYTVVRANAKMLQAFGDIETIPTTFVIDRKGGMVSRHEGFTAKEEFAKEIAPLLKP